MVFHGRGIVWDAKNDKILARFVNGSFETHDKRVIGLLSGYPHDEEPVIEAIRIPLELRVPQKRPPKKKVSE